MNRYLPSEKDKKILELQIELHDIYSSRSWKITAFLRFLNYKSSLIRLTLMQMIHTSACNISNRPRFMIFFRFIRLVFLYKKMFPYYQLQTHSQEINIIQLDEKTLRLRDEVFDKLKKRMQETGEKSGDF